ncbi:CDP-diacylglycerol--serine O-phosphatidyltransferase [Chlamydiales bacterium STE3]|nr:CDP-diacylglycerol--serine O-phosphatidyltransferase [Chlamydiales bacterium STE3]
MHKTRKVPVLPNIITAFALTCGLFVIFKINMTPVGEADMQVLTATAGILLLSAFADLFDGAIARALKAESSFGGFFDSLADAITFGAGPPLIVLKSLSITPGTDFSFFLTAAAMVYTVCGVLRLVRFNVVSLLEKENPDLMLAGKKNFTGLPIPAAAAAVVSANLLLVSEEFRSFLPISEDTRAWILFAILIIIGYFMVSRWKFPSLKTLHIRVASFQVVLMTVLGAVIIFYGILNHFPLVFAAVTWGYVVVAWSLSITRMITGRNSTTLEDFEPEPDEFDEE